MARFGAQHSSREEAEAIRARLAAESPGSSFFVFQREDGWVVAKADVKPSAMADGTAIAARPKPDANDPRDANPRNIPPLGGGPL
jgi:hypothetical protein